MDILTSSVRLICIIAGRKEGPRSQLGVLTSLIIALKDEESNAGDNDERVCQSRRNAFLSLFLVI